MSADVSYLVSVPRPADHLAHIELSISDASELGDSLELEMAAWSPGSYLRRDYARFVRAIEATADGAPAAVVKVGLQRWRVDTGGARQVVVRYQVYGHELSVRTNHIDDSHAFLHGPATFLYVAALRHRPHRVVVDAPDWPVVAGLPLADEPDSFVAADLDELLDGPLHLGPVDRRSFRCAGAPVELVVWGDLDGDGVADLDQLAADLEIVVEHHALRMGGVPYRRYTFILMLSPGAYGGLEHRSSSANLSSPYVMATDNDYRDLLELLSHEYFHIWNGKRIVPAGLAPIDYAREQPTRCLWVVEGLTSYYDRYTLRRADRMSVARYLEKLCEEWGRLQWTPGRAMHSLQESSFDAWIKLYKAHESNLNTTVSYYLKGGLVALALDFAIRRRSDGARTLDVVLQHLWREYGAVGQPYPETVEPLFEAAAGVELDDLFQRLVRGCEDPDLAGELAAAGLELRATWDPLQLADERTPVWLGLQLKAGTRVAAVLDDSPAAVAGIGPGDELIAVDRRRVKSEAGLRKRLGLRSPGDHVDIALFRRGRLREIAVELVRCPPTRFEIAGVAEPTAAQQAFYSAWLDAEHPATTEVIAGATLGRYV